MASTITPTWTDGVTVIGSSGLSSSLTRGSTLRGTIDLRGKYGAMVHILFGRGGTAALTNGVDFIIRATISNGAQASPGIVWRQRSQSVAGVSTTVATSNSNSGQPAINVASSTSFAADDFVIIAPGTAGREEWVRVSKVAAGVVTADANLINSHTTGQADPVRNKCDCWQVSIGGGALYEVIADYGDDAAGDDGRVLVMAQTFDSNAAT